MAQRDLGDQPLESGPIDATGSGPAQVIVDDHHAGRRPAQGHGPVDQPVLQPGRLGVAYHLHHRGLSHVDDR